MKLTLVNTKAEAGDVRTFIFQPEQPITWAPGQYMHYVIPGTDQDGQEDNRWFTISAAPSEGHLAISTRIMEQPSHFKQALVAMQIGDQIEADGPEGAFTIEDPSRNHLFIAGGIGITPFRSMLAEAAVKNQPLNVHLLYAARDEQVAFRDELEEIAAQNPSLKISYVIQPERLDADRLKAEIEAIERPVIYVSGPEPMVEAMEAQLEGLGVSKDDIKTDYFPGYEAD